MRTRIGRKEMLRFYGFGIDNMKALTVCPECSSLESSHNSSCSKCGAKLSKENLYDLYRSKHKCCPKCKTVLSDNMQFCPHCGKRNPNSERTYVTAEVSI